MKKEEKKANGCGGNRVSPHEGGKITNGAPYEDGETEDDDTRQMQTYMKQKSLDNRRLEFKGQTNIIETRENIKGK